MLRENRWYGCHGVRLRGAGGARSHDASLRRPNRTGSTIPTISLYLTHIKKVPPINGSTPPPLYDRNRPALAGAFHSGVRPVLSVYNKLAKDKHVHFALTECLQRICRRIYNGLTFKVKGRVKNYWYTRRISKSFD